MPRATDTAPNRYQTFVDAYIVEDDPLIAVVNFETDDGLVELLFNRAGAEQFQQVLAALLDGEIPTL